MFQFRRYKNKNPKPLKENLTEKYRNFIQKTHDTRRKSKSPTSKTGKVEKGKWINNKLNRPYVIKNTLLNYNAYNHLFSL